MVAPAFLRYWRAMSWPPAVPPRLRTIATPERLRLLQQFMQFGTVGFAGFLVDTLVVYALRGAIGLYAAGMVSFVLAVTTTWAGNRAWTFAGTFAGRGSGGMVRQWARYIAANSLGAVLNRGTFMLLVFFVPLCERYPVLAILAGVASGMGANFHMSRRVVFGGTR